MKAAVQAQALRSDLPGRQQVRQQRLGVGRAPAWGAAGVEALSAEEPAWVEEPAWAS
jgi:hypothetical protein